MHSPLSGSGKKTLGQSRTVPRLEGQSKSDLTVVPKSSSGVYIGRPSLTEANLSRVNWLVDSGITEMTTYSACRLVTEHIRSFE